MSPPGYAPPKSSLTAPTAPHEVVAELLGVIERLTEVLVLETASLSQTRPQPSNELAVTKSRLVVRYETLLGALTLHSKEQLKAIPGFERVVPSATQLNLLAEENAQAIKRHLDATQHVLEIVARAARKAAEPNFSYGKARLGYGVHSHRGSAVAVNRVL